MAIVTVATFRDYLKALYDWANGLKEPKVQLSGSNPAVARIFVAANIESAPGATIRVTTLEDIPYLEISVACEANNIIPSDTAVRLVWLEESTPHYSNDVVQTISAKSGGSRRWRIDYVRCVTTKAAIEIVNTATDTIRYGVHVYGRDPRR